MSLIFKGNKSKVNKFSYWLESTNKGRNRTVFILKCDGKNKTHHALTTQSSSLQPSAMLPHQHGMHCRQEWGEQSDTQQELSNFYLTHSKPSDHKSVLLDPHQLFYCYSYFPMHINLLCGLHFCITSRHVAEVYVEVDSTTRTAA